MSSDLFPSVKSKKHVLLSTAGDVMESLLDEVKRDQRSLSYVVSKIVEAYYGERERKVV